MSQASPSAMQSFSYTAQTSDGRPFTGTIDAADSADAQRQLQTLQLRVVQIDPVAQPARPKALSGDDFIAFNQQLAQLTAAGMPVEQGLRLIAQDMRTGRLAVTIRQLVAELESGHTLSEAFERYRGQFPPLYAQLVEAGIKSNNLSGVLFNLGEHLDLTHRLKATLWRELSYPAMVLVGLLVVITFVGLTAISGLRETLLGFQVNLPLITQIIFLIAKNMPVLATAAILAILFVVIFWQALRFSPAGRMFRDRVSLRLPLIGLVLRRNLAARWCDAVRLGVVAGLDLPASIDLAANAVRSPLAELDGQDMVTLLQSGRRIEEFTQPRVLPSTIPTAIALGSDRHDLAGTLASLSDLYQRQAQVRLDALPAIITPLYVVVLALILGTVITGMFLPLVKLIQSVSGG